jgi:hypothetical protein
MDSGFSSTNIPQTGSFATFFLLFIVITTCISVGLYNCKNIIRQFTEENRKNMPLQLDNYDVSILKACTTTIHLW